MTIDVENLTFSYDKILILKNVSVHIKKGEFIGIFGPNGGGKTTFLKLLLGLLEPTSGSITIDDEEIAHTRKKMGYVPQMKSFDKQFPITVLEVILQGCLNEMNWWGGFPRRVKTKARDALKQVGLIEKENSAFGTLSGGQMQRALIARALIQSPQILLLDEPTASIDIEAEQVVHDLLLNLKGSMTILMVTHDLNAILDKADRLLCIHQQLTSYLPKEVCDHFTLGLYHPPKVNVNNKLKTL